VVKGEMEKFTDLQKLQFSNGIKDHYQSAGKYLLQQADVFSQPILKLLRALDPRRIKESNAPTSMSRLAELVPSGAVPDQVRVEMLLLQGEHLSSKLSLSVEEFWSYVFKIMATDDRPRYPELCKLVSTCLALPHGNSEVERGFSVSGKILTNQNTAMCTETLSGRLCVRDALVQYNNDPLKVPVTKEMIRAAHMSYKRYDEHLEEQRKQAQREAEKQNVSEQKRKADLMEADSKRKKIDKLHSSIFQKSKEEQDHMVLSNRLIKEAETKIAEAMANKDFTNLRFAQEMLKSATARSGDAIVALKENEQNLKKVTKEQKTLLIHLAKK
jgi:hypothetical protein